MKKKALSILLILCMVMSMLPVMGISAFVVPVEGATGNTVYIDGAWGGKGNDTNTGEDKDYPVKTLQKALELAGAGGTIYACGEIQQLGTLENDTIDISNVTFKRAEDFTKNIIDVNWFGGGKLTINLSNVIFDGEGKDVNRYSGGELITVTGAVVLNMNEGTQLINNQDSAIQVASGATLNMKGGVIKNNHAERKSGGITIWHGDVNLTGGEISNNSTLDCGGGIQAIGECNIVLDKEKNNEGVVIKENSAVYGGGGVYLEGRKASNQYNPVTLSFTMNNGSIISNHALSWEESYDGDTWENYSPGGGIFAFKHDYDETVVTINGGTIKENTTMEEDYGAAMVFKNNQRGQYGFPQLKMSGSPDISGDVLFFDEETVGPVVEVTAEFTPVNPVPLISNYGSEGTTVVTYAQGLSPENSKEQFVSVVKSMGLLANAQNLEWVELNRVDFIWGNATNDRKRVYVYPDNPVLESDAPAPTLTGYTLDGWVCYGEYVKWDFDTIIKGTTSLYSIWKLNAPTVTVTADKEAAHFDDVITLTATASHALGGGVTYSYQWYKDGAAIDSANTNMLQVSAPGAYTVKVKANDGKKDSEETESSAVTAVFGHLTVENIEKKDATCTENGNTEYWHCTDCNKYFSDEACTTEIDMETTVISKTGHVETEIQGAKNAACTEDGYTGDKVCKDCGEVVEAGKTIAKLSHSYKDGKCTVCGATDPDYKPNEGDPDSPQTGDSSDIALWFVLMAATGISLAGTAVYGRKKHMQK